MAERLGVPAVPAEVHRLVSERARGNPFFAGELALALRDLGLISVSGSGCRVVSPTGDLPGDFDRALATHGAPSTLQGVVTSRIDQLSGPARDLIRLASAIGRTVPLAALEGSDDRHDAAGRRSALDELVGRDLLHAVPDGTDPAIVFRHAITQEVTYGALPFGERRRIHRRIAEWYESRPASTLPGAYGLLAHHWMRAEATPEALRYLALAGEQAVGSYANQEAVRFFTDALTLAGRPEAAVPPATQAGWELQLGRAYVQWSHYPEGQRHLETGLSLAGERVPHGGITALALLRETARQTVRRLGSAGRSAAPQKQDDLLLLARAWESLIETNYLANAALPCVHAALRSLNLAERAGPSAELARGYASVGAIVGFIPLRGLADSYGRRALETAEAIGDPAAQLWAALARGVYLAGIGHWAESEAMLVRTAELAERLSDRRHWDDTAQNRAATWYLQGDYHRSSALADQLLASASARSDGRGQAVALRRRGYCLLATGDESALPAVLTELGTIHWGIGDLYSEGPPLALAARLAFRRGDLAAAAEAIRQLVPIVAGTVPSFHDALLEYATASHGALLLEHAGVFQQPGDRELTRRALRALGRYARIFPVGRPDLELARAFRARAAGRASAARHWSAAAQAAARLGMPAQDRQALSETLLP